MKKIYKVFIIIILIEIMCIPRTYCNILQDLDGEVKIPNSDGQTDIYTDIYSVDELYSVLEDLSQSYNSLFEKYNSLENDNMESNKEIEKLKEELDTYKQDNVKNSNSTVLIIFVCIGIIIGILYLISRNN
nr:MAG TPA: hypothetical protein [Caudoviricetes sp.]